MPDRPDPEALLKRVQEDEARAQRARFKVFFGAAPGVGKTYAMLQEAQRRRDEGMDVVIGVVETHRRAETMAMLAGLDVLPRKTVVYRGVTLDEFNLDAALERHPDLILMDELAHTNAPGCRHAKRWQDVMELLDAGIDVYSTMNVQHLESLKEVVAQITGVVVQERVPDTVLERCDEMELVDISVEELTQRLAEGKVYVPDQARHAIQRFFRRGNLLALRELALRRTAELVDADMRRYREARGIRETWAAGERLMVCITPRPASEALLRATRRHAEAQGASWLAVYVETGRRLSEADRERLESHLRTAERLGGEGVVLSGHGALAEDILTLARSRNVTQILLGRPDGPRWLERIRGSLLADLAASSGSIHVHVIPESDTGTPFAFTPSAPSPWPRPGQLLLCGVYVALATGLSMLVHRRLELADVVMIYTIPILLAATRYGRNAALATSALAVLAFDFFFIPPRFTLAIGDMRHLGTFVILLLLGLVIGNLTERVRQQAIRAQQREQRTLALYRLGEALVQAGDRTETIAAALRAVQSQFQARVSFFLPDTSGRLECVASEGVEPPRPDEAGVAQWAFDHGQPAGKGTDVLPGAGWLYLPLKGHRRPVGVMGLTVQGGPLWAEPDQRHILEAFANQTALAVERATLSAEAQAASLRVEREELRNTLLSSVSHDLRTPLAGITGAATTLLEDPGTLPEGERRDLLGSIQEEAFRLHRLVSNLLQLTRLESGEPRLAYAWLPPEELVGSALERLGKQAEGREVHVTVDRPTTLIHGDPVLLEQVLINLLENAFKFAPEGAVEVEAYGTGQGTTLVVSDHGTGIPEGMETKIFDKLFRLPGHGQTTGAGLGLAICKGIVEAHGGHIQAGSHPKGGARFVLSLPHREPLPAAPEEETPRGT